MDDLKKKAESIADNQNIIILKDRLKTYSHHLNNIEWAETDHLGMLRVALRKHINLTISKSSCDLEEFIKHFGS